MSISTYNPANAQKQRIRTPSLIIIEFVYDQLPHTGTAGQLLYLSLVQNYAVAPEKLHHELIFFDISTTGQLVDHTAQASEAAKVF
jgi:hypothetical protein